MKIGMAICLPYRFLHLGVLRSPQVQLVRGWRYVVSRYGRPGRAYGHPSYFHRADRTECALHTIRL